MFNKVWFLLAKVDLLKDYLNQLEWFKYISKVYRSLNFLVNYMQYYYLNHFRCRSHV